jgi:hypothetical protein
MRRLKLTWIALGCGILAATVESVFIGAVAPVVAQEDLESIEIEPALKDVDKDDDTEMSTSDADEFSDDVVDPKEVYLELVRKKADLLTPDELTRETLALRRELSELQATIKLRSAEQQLHKLIDEFPTSGAAERAKRMLRGGLHPVPTFEHAPRAVPLPESNPEEVFGPTTVDPVLQSPPEFLDDRVPPRKPLTRPLKPAVRPVVPQFGN